MWRRIAFGTLTFLFGFRFCMSCLTSRDIPFDTVEFTMNHGKPFKFIFYKQPIELHMFRFGVMRSRMVVRYGIKPSFEDSHPDLVQQFKDRMMSFHVPFAAILSDRMIARFMLNVYVMHLHEQLRRFRSKTD